MMKYRIVLLLVFSLFLSWKNVYSQVKFYKVENGVKTLLKDAEQLTIPIDENRVPVFNVLMEVDISAFKKAYTYAYLSAVANIVGTTSVHDDVREERVNWNLGSELFANKYGSEKTLQYYLFQTDEVIKNPKYMFFYKNKITDLSMTEKSWEFNLYGAYKTGTEKYYEGNSVKTRDVFSNYELIPLPTSPVIKFNIPASVLVNEKYERLVKLDNMMSDGLMGIKTLTRKLEEEKRLISSVKRNIAMVTNVEAYPELVRAMEIVYTTREKTIQAETDKQKAIDLVAAWNGEYEYLIVSGGKLDEDKLKALNKKLKGLKDPDAIMTVYKTYNSK